MGNNMVRMSFDQVRKFPSEMAMGKRAESKAALAFDSRPQSRSN
jgi:hypothetical protein